MVYDTCFLQDMHHSFTMFVLGWVHACTSTSLRGKQELWQISNPYWINIQVLPPLKTAPVGGKAALPPLSKAPAQPVQPVSSTSPLQPGGPSSSAPAESTAGQAGVKLLKQPREAYAAVTAQTSLLQGPPLGPVTESMRSDKQPKRVTADQVGHEVHVHPSTTCNPLGCCWAPGRLT